MEKKRLTVALVAHDAMKRDLAEWVAWNWEKLLSHRLVCTGTTGRIVAETLIIDMFCYREKRSSRFPGQHVPG